ncbi:probable calcium-binding protein CML41 [Ananas comosus]|uniref:Probable calcium-binding protein CML41 n=1 Tax=Ananas comosus TaxID=4615 RepID=A0A6P5GM20_ANACO|nr:probable calcium-binding protein CML41 [Ananas comosus]
MATNNAGLSKPHSKWLLNKSFKISLHRLRRSTSSSKPAASGSATASSSPMSSAGRAREYYQVFRRFDADGDGKISSHELRSFLLWAGEKVAADEAERVVADLDSDGDGLMDYGDFVRLMERDNGGNEEGGGDEDEDLRRAFEMFEIEKGSGCITAKGLQQVLGRLGDVRSSEECEAMIRAYDLDGDGVVDYHEFQLMMN